MLDRLLHALIRSDNEAADDLLLQALRLGNESEQATVLGTLLTRKTARGLSGVIGAFATLSENHQGQILRNIRTLHHALAECGRSKDPAPRLAAMRLIAIGRQGKLAYVLSENLHDPDEALSKAAIEALVALARWVATETRRLQRGAAAPPPGEDTETRRRGDAETAGEAGGYEAIINQRPEIESAVARAMNVHRGKHGPDLLRAALLLADWPGSKTLAILQAGKQGGQGAMVRRLQQSPDAEHVEAFLLGATHGHLRTHFGVAFSHIEQAPVLDALLRRTHWLKDQQLQLCMHQVTRGAWWGISELSRDIDRRTVADAALIGEWIGAGGLHDVEQDERLELMYERIRIEADAASTESTLARLRLLRIAMRRKRGTSTSLLKAMLGDSDERIVRMGAREIVRRRPADFENLLLKLMTSASSSIRRVIGRTIGQVGFEQFWQRFEKLDRPMRQSAGKAMFKLLPDAVQRLERRALSGPPEQRVKALQIAHELGAAEAMRHVLLQLCLDSNPRVRSKAVAVMGDVPSIPGEFLVERLLKDTDSRVRANAIEVLEARRDPKLVPALSGRALAATGRERANAIRAMHRMRIGAAAPQLLAMLKDSRAEHRISALWTLRQLGFWQMLQEVAHIARDDTNVRVKRYALGVLKNVAELARDRRVG